MNDLDELGAALHRATDRLETPGFAHGALVAARRRRAAHRSLLASAAVVVLVGGVTVGSRLGGSGAVDPAPAPATTSQPAGPVVPTTTAPAIAPDRIQDVWDPRSAEGEPVVQLGVPRVMESLVPGDVAQPVAVLDDGSRPRLVSAAGLVEDLALPSELARSRTVSLSPDGQRLVASGSGGLFWRELDGDWQRIESADIPTAALLAWLPDSTGVVARGSNGAVLVDLGSGEVEDQAFLEGSSSVHVAPDGTLVGVTESREVVQWRGGHEVDRVSTAKLEGLVLPVAGEAVIAFARAHVSIADPPGKSDEAGLLALDRETFEARAYLPVPDDQDYDVHAQELRPLAWLDGDTLAFTVLPEGARKEYLMTWDVETGEISRVSCWERSVDAVFALDLLG